MPSVRPNPAAILRERGRVVFWMRCSAVMVGSAAASRDVNRGAGVRASLPNWMCPGSAPGPAPARNLQRRHQHLKNHRSPRGRGWWPCVQLPDDSRPRPGRRCVLWQRVKQRTHGRLAGSADRISSPPPPWLRFDPTQTLSC